MGQTISGLSNPPRRPLPCEYAETLEFLESFGPADKSYDRKTQDLIRKIDIHMGLEANEDLVLASAIARDSFKDIPELIAQECFGEDYDEDNTPAYIERWIYNIWFVIEKTVVAQDYRHASLCALKQFRIIIEMRDHERNSPPADVLEEYARILRNMFDTPSFGLSKEIITLFVRFLQPITNVEPRNTD